MVKVKVNPEGKFKYTTDAEGEYHSFNDLPAIEYFGNDNTKIWMFHGLIHRDKYPAIEIGNIKEYYNKGELILRRENNNCLYKGYIQLNPIDGHYYDIKNNIRKSHNFVCLKENVALNFSDNKGSINIFNIEPEYVMLNIVRHCSCIFEDDSYNQNRTIDSYKQNGFKICNKCTRSRIWYYFINDDNSKYENFRYYCFCEEKIKELIKP